MSSDLALSIVIAQLQRNLQLGKNLEAPVLYVKDFLDILDFNMEKKATHGQQVSILDIKCSQRVTC